MSLTSCKTANTLISPAVKEAPPPASVKSRVSADVITRSAETVTLGAYAPSDAPSMSNAVTYSLSSAPVPRAAVASVPVFCVALEVT